MSIALNEEALAESKSIRAALTARTEVLDKVKVLALLPDDLHVTVEMIAAYYEVDKRTIERVIVKNRTELEANGYTVLKGDDFKKFVADLDDGHKTFSSKARSITLFNRRTVLNVGMLLTESEVAKRIRQYLLDVEEQTSDQVKADVLEIPLEEYKQLKTSAYYWHVISAGTKADTFSSVCATLSADPQISVGRDTLLQALRAKKVLMNSADPQMHNLPYAAWYKYFTRGKEVVETAQGMRTNYVTKVKPEGVIWLRQQILKGKLPGLVTN